MSNALGIDLGTSKVAAVIVDDKGKPLDSISVLLPERAESGTMAERDPQSIFQAVDTAVKGLNATAKQSVGVIGVCGQMHGVLLWNDLARDHSPLITWEDRRADEGVFLDELRQSTGVTDIHAGYGAVTLAWLKENDPDTLTKYRHAGTIMDYLVARCCGFPKPVMDPTNAAGWGFFDARQRKWKRDPFYRTGVPDSFLPEVKPTGSLAGPLTDALAEDWGLSEKPAVAIACGDNPAAVFSCREELENSVFLNVGTGSQLAIVVSEEALSGIDFELGLEMRPFLPNQYLVVAASSCGGQAFQWLVKSVQGWCRELGVDVPDNDSIYGLLNDLGGSAASSELPDFKPYFTADRHHPGMLGSISGIGWSNFSLGCLAKSLAKGIIDSMWSLFPASLLQDKSVIMATGNGMRRLPLLRTAAEDVMGLPVRVPELYEESATGAARLARHFLG